MRIVLDTNVIVSALLSPAGPPARVLALVAEARVSVLLDERVLAEYQRVLEYRKFGFRPAVREEIFDYLVDFGERVAGPFAAVDLPHRQDAKFLEVAIAGRADALVTGNLRHFPVGARQGVRVLSPAEFMEEFGR